MVRVNGERVLVPVLVSVSRAPQQLLLLSLVRLQAEISTQSLAPPVLVPLVVVSG